MTDDVLMQKLASIDRCLRSIRTFVAGDLNRLNDQIVHDAAVLNVQRAYDRRSMPPVESFRSGSSAFRATARMRFRSWGGSDCSPRRRSPACAQ